MDPTIDSFDLGVVTKKTISSYTVRAGERSLTCGLASRFHKGWDESKANRSHSRKGRQASRHNTAGDPVDIVVGDRVRFIAAPDGTGTIVDVLPRRNRLSRRSAVPMPSARPFEQVIAANLDQVVPVFAAANPAPKWNMLDRYLVSAESSGLPALICITKLDLAQGPDGALDEELEDVAEEYRSIGYGVILNSVVTGEGLDELRQALQGHTSVLLGKSGVGKTSLLNAIQPGLGLRVNEVSQVTGKGKHTTTHLEMVPLEGGGALVDTPGVREFGLWDVEDVDLALFFPEMRSLVPHCRFGLDCRHDNEPGCAVRQAVSAGQISPRRYTSYLRLRYDR